MGQTPNRLRCGSIWSLPERCAAAGSSLVQPPAHTEVEVRSLTDYDTALGITADLDGGAA